MVPDDWGTFLNLVFTGEIVFFKKPSHKTLTNVSLWQGLIVHYMFQNFSTCVTKAHRRINHQFYVTIGFSWCCSDNYHLLGFYIAQCAFLCSHVSDKPTVSTFKVIQLWLDKAPQTFLLNLHIFLTPSLPYTSEIIRSTLHPEYGHILLLRNFRTIKAY
jgi:hypothetical protein